MGDGGVLEIGGYTYVYHGSVLDPGTDGFTTAGVHMRGGQLVAAGGSDGLHLDDVGFVNGWGDVLLDLHMGGSGLIDGFASTPLVIHGQISGTGLITRCNPWFGAQYWGFYGWGRVGGESDD